MFWTLLIGLLVLWGMDGVREALRKRGKAPGPENGRAAALLKTDYSRRGVLLIAVIGLLKRDLLLLVIDAPCAFLFFFHLFYPVHLLILLFCRQILYAL